MNRIILIGNGFDLAHGLKTRYQDFIDWYWNQRICQLMRERSAFHEDPLCSFELTPRPECSTLYFYTTYELGFAKIKDLSERKKLILKPCKVFKSSLCEFFENINRSVETKGWVDIENEYYRLLKKYCNEDGSIVNRDRIITLNTQLQFLQDKLCEYLNTIQITDQVVNSTISDRINERIHVEDISTFHLHRYMEDARNKIKQKSQKFISESPLTTGLVRESSDDTSQWREKLIQNKIIRSEEPNEFNTPEQVLFLNFNYTETAAKYKANPHNPRVVYIHGQLGKPVSIIFGYGDELDVNYKKLQEQNDNVILDKIKSIRYLESDNYRRMLQFIETAQFQVYIMGHSCGNSDRTLLNTIFEHPNCASIKPFYYKREDGTDNYLELVQNISRNFTDMKLFRDRVVNKEYCTTLK